LINESISVIIIYGLLIKGLVELVYSEALSSMGPLGRKETQHLTLTYFYVSGFVSISFVLLMTFASSCQVWPLEVAEFDLGVSPEGSWVSLIGVIKVLSSKMMSMLQFHVEGAQTVVQSLALNEVWIHESLWPYILGWDHQVLFHLMKVLLFRVVGMVGGELVL
jgi:hypothetical protein